MNIKSIAYEQKNKRIEKLVEYWKPIIKKQVKNNAHNGYDTIYILLDNKSWFKNVQIFSVDIEIFIYLLKKDIFFNELTIEYKQDQTPMLVPFIHIISEKKYEHPYYLIIKLI